MLDLCQSLAALRNAETRILPGLAGSILQIYISVMAIGCNRIDLEVRRGPFLLQFINGPYLLHIINVFSIVSFYALILIKMITTRSQHPDKTTHGDQLKSISKTLILLSGAYIAFSLPYTLLLYFFTLTDYKSKIVIAGIISW